MRRTAGLSWTVDAAAAGTATLGIRYAKGTTADRPADISVNGTVVAAASSFAPTGAWTTWVTKTVTRAREISWVNWNYSDDFRCGAVFTEGTCPGGRFAGTSRLKPAGQWVRDHLRNPADDF